MIVSIFVCLRAGLIGEVVPFLGKDTGGWGVERDRLAGDAVITLVVCTTPTCDHGLICYSLSGRISKKAYGNTLASISPSWFSSLLKMKTSSRKTKMSVVYLIAKREIVFGFETIPSLTF